MHFLTETDLISVEASKNENYFADTTLYSFVAPNGVLYKIDRGDENDPTVPVLGKAIDIGINPTEIERN